MVENTKLNSLSLLTSVKTKPLKEQRERETWQKTERTRQIEVIHFEVVSIQD
jgi:hypothetical protein